MTNKQAYAGLLERLVNRICLEVCELPDRTSPEDWPEACLVTPEELSDICSGVLTEAISSLLKALERIATHESSVSDSHMECENCKDAFLDDYAACKAIARAALSGEKL